MELDIRGLGLDPTPALRRDVERRLRRSFRSFDARIERVSVQLVREHGRSSRGPGRCVITVSASGLEPVRARQVNRSLRIACSRAITQARHGLARAAQRARGLRRRRRQSPLPESRGAGEFAAEQLPLAG